MSTENSKSTYKFKPDEYPDLEPIKEIWESFGGSIWIITEIMEDGTGFGYAKLSAHPQGAELGYISRDALQSESKVWEVEHRDWENVNTYEGIQIEQI